MVNDTTILAVLAATVLAVAGCARSEPAPPATTDTAGGRSKQLLTTEPEGASSVLEMRETAQDWDEVVVVGRIGGSEHPWVDGRAAFSIVDLTLQACSDIEGDECETPWDYCCETDRLPQATALVKLTDDQGSLLATDARELLQVKELRTVVVRGKARRDDAGNVTIQATGLYVRP
jgi:hypothetical protein